MVINMKNKLPLRVKISFAILIAMLIGLVIVVPIIGVFVIGFSAFMYAGITIAQYYTWKDH